MKTSKCTATSGCTCTTPTSNHWLFPSTMSVTRLAEQGFNTQLNEAPTITHTKGFNSALKQGEGLYFLPVVLVTLPTNMRLEVNQTTEGLTSRHGDPSQQEPSVDIQQPRVLGKSPQNKTQGIVHARQQMSSSSRKVGKLQKNSHTQTKKQHRTGET